MPIELERAVRLSLRRREGFGRRLRDAWLLVILPVVFPGCTPSTSGSGNFISSCQNMVTGGIVRTCIEHYADSSVAANVSATWTPLCQDQGGTVSKARCPATGSVGSCTIAAAGSAAYGVFDKEFFYTPGATTADAMSSCTSAGGQFEPLPGGGSGAGGGAGGAAGSTTSAAGSAGSSGHAGGAGASGGGGTFGGVGTSGGAGAPGAAGTSGGAGASGGAGPSGAAGAFGGAGASGGAGSGGAGTSGGAGAGTTLYGLTTGDSCFDVVSIAGGSNDGCGDRPADAVGTALLVNYTQATGTLTVGPSGSLGSGPVAYNKGTLTSVSTPVSASMATCSWHQSDTSHVTVTGTNELDLSVSELHDTFQAACTSVPTGGMCTSTWAWHMKKSSVKTPPSCQ